MADESAWTPQDVLALHRAGAAEMISLYYTGRAGCRAKRVAAVAEAAGMASTSTARWRWGWATRPTCTWPRRRRR